MIYTLLLYTLYKLYYTSGARVHGSVKKAGIKFVLVVIVYRGNLCVYVMYILVHSVYNLANIMISNMPPNAAPYLATVMPFSSEYEIRPYALLK